MSHSFNKIWIHAVFSTKDRAALISKDVEPKLFSFIQQQLTDSGCMVKCINGMSDHVHILFLLNPLKSVADVLKNLKGGSSHWVNQNNLTQNKFAWQVGYGAFSVSESQIDKIRTYIEQQKIHHRKLSFADEYNNL
ncbi:MAG: family transposase [Bacteroidota bacterium]|jgi:REP element-mobilizing transposase RayT